MTDQKSWRYDRQSSRAHRSLPHCAVRSSDVLDMSRQQQLIHHEEGEQRRHSIIGESFPRFGEGEIEKTFGVTHEGRCTGARHMRFIWVQLKEVESRRYKMGSRMDVEVRCVVSGL